MTRFIRIALIVLCITSCVGTALAVSSAADSATLTESHTLCNTPCLSSGVSCFSASECEDVRNLKKACCFGVCVYCL